MSKEHPRSSRQRYGVFVQDYKHGRLDDVQKDGDDKSAEKTRRGHRREYLRQYVRWFWPYRFAVGAVLLLALIAAGLEMVQPLFMRYIIDHVLLKSGLTTAARLARLHVAGVAFLSVIVVSNLIGVLKDYRQRLLNVRVMLTLRRDDDRPAADGRCLPRRLDHSTGRRRGRAAHVELALGVDGVGDHSRRHADELHARAPRAAHLSHGAEGYRAD
jgi:hypothetical protein